MTKTDALRVRQTILTSLCFRTDSARRREYTLRPGQELPPRDAEALVQWRQTVTPELVTTAAESEPVAAPAPERTETTNDRQLVMIL